MISFSTCLVCFSCHWCLGVSPRAWEPALALRKGGSSLVLDLLFWVFGRPGRVLLERWRWERGFLSFSAYLVRDWVRLGYLLRLLLTTITAWRAKVGGSNGEERGCHSLFCVGVGGERSGHHFPPVSEEGLALFATIDDTRVRIGSLAFICLLCLLMCCL